MNPIPWPVSPHRTVYTRRRLIPAKLFPVILLFLVAYGLPAQEMPADTGSTGSTVEENTELLSRSLVRDIETAGLDELAAWCRVVGLDDQGTEDQLKRLLYGHYGLSATPAMVTTESTGTRITIESAGRSEYLNMVAGEAGDESIVRLSGNVVVSVHESERGRTHRVSADTVVFNQERRTITAIGDIEYVVDSGGSEETFTGDSLTFEVNDWTGVIFRGTSERKQNVDGTDVEFFFRGDSIKRVSKDILVLENGVITSHDSDNPDYALKAKKIWITGPGEWGLLQATLYVGHIPVFFFPFYWKSGSSLLFNPVLGTRTRSGYYIQTTSYILGRKDADDGFSILGFGDSAGDSYDQERQGLYLVRVPSEGVEDDRKEQSDATLKYMLDVYTSIGAMTGFLGEFPSVGKNGSIDFYATMGVSRSVEDNGSPYFRDDTTGLTGTYWNSSYVGRATLPFRWGTRLDMSFGNWTMYADWFSDPYYYQDFQARSENFDWLSFLLSEQETDTLNTDVVTEMLWEVKGSHKFNVSEASPWLQSIGFDAFRTSLTWRNTENTDITGSDNPDKEQDPARSFFFPDKLVLPDLQFSLRGGAPQWIVNSVVDPKELEDPDSPGEDPAEDDAGGDPAEEGPDAAEYIGSFDAVYSNKLLTASFTYGLQSQLYVEDYSSSTDWEAPSDIDFLFEPARVNTTHLGNMSYGMDFWDGLTGVKGTTKLSGYYQVHADLFNSGIPITDTTRLEDYRYSQFLWDNSFSVYFNPLQGIPSLSESKLSYDFDGNIYAFSFDDAASVSSPNYSGSWLTDKDDIRTHEALARGVWKRWGLSVDIGLTSNIPPLDQRHNISAAAGYSGYGWSAKLSQQVNFEDDTWTIQPVIMSGSWTGWKDEVTVSQSARFDVENNRWSTIESRLLFWGFDTRFVANYGTDYNWHTTNYVWETAGESFAPSSLQFGYTRDFSPIPLWKNRITMSTVLNTSWNINLRQPTDNVLTFKWTQEFHIYKFLDLTLSFSSTNKAMYLYFQGWRDQLNIPDSYNFFTDLAKSFNIFNKQDRLDSQFNMDRFDIALVHHLRNWDLTVEYSGWPALVESAYKWKSEFSLFIKWNPLPMFNQRTRYQNYDWSVDSFE